MLSTHLAGACSQARKTAGVSQRHVATIIGVNQSSVANFENEGLWVRDPDRYVAGYSTACHTAPLALWRTALEQYEREEPEAATPAGVPPEMVAIEEALAAAVDAQARGRANRRSEASTP